MQELVEQILHLWSSVFFARKCAVLSSA